MPNEKLSTLAEHAAGARLRAVALAASVLRSTTTMAQRRAVAVEAAQGCTTGATPNKAAASRWPTSARRLK